MKRPAMSRPSLSLLIKVGCACFCLASVLVFAGSPPQQSPNRATLKSDRKNPRKAPEKTAPRKAPETGIRGGQTSGSPNTADAARSPLDAPAAAGAPPQGCDYHTVLVRDTIRVIYVNLYNYPPNSIIPVTMTQTNAGVMGFARTDAGPFTPTLNIEVSTDGNGDGTSDPVYTQGQIVGGSVVYGETPYAATTTVEYNVLPQCNCPAIPVVP